MTIIVVKKLIDSNMEQYYIYESYIYVGVST